MDKLNKLAMPDVKSGTPQEKMNAVKKALQSLEMLTEAYNQIVPVINAKIDWLTEVEKVAKDDTQDKKIDELIAVNKMLLGRVAKLESKGDYDDSALTKRVKALESKPDYKYDDRYIIERVGKLESKPDYKYNDKPIKKMIDEITKQQGELARAQNSLSREIKSIEIPKVPSIEPLRKRIKALENKPQYVYDDKVIKERVKKLENAPKHAYDDKSLKARIAKLEDKPESPKAEKYDDSVLVGKMSDIEKSTNSLDKRLDFIKRTYSEKWQKAEFERVKFQQLIDEQIREIETPIEYDDKPVLKEIDSIKKELSDVKKSFNEIFE